MLHAISRGIKIVTAEWVLRSFEARRWLPTEPYIALQPSPVPGRQLDGARFFLGPSLAKFSEKQLRDLVHVAGGVPTAQARAQYVVGTNRKLEAQERVTEEAIISQILGETDGLELHLHSPLVKHLIKTVN